MATTHRYDLIVVGAGKAGVTAAEKCASRGWDVAIVDGLPYGGTCALRGCDPKKILRRGAEIVESARLLDGNGIDARGLSVDWGRLIRRKHGFTSRTAAAVEEGLAGKGVETLHGEARFIDEDTLDVDGAGRSATRFLIATGARPRTLDFPGAEHLIDSTQFLDVPELPARILFVGGGFISFEFAHIVARAGSSALIVDHGARPLRTFDPDLVNTLVRRGEDVGVRVRTETAISRVDRAGSSFHVQLDTAGRSDTVDVDLVVHGAGRVPDLDRLGLGVAGIAFSQAGVTVAPHLQSVSSPAVWAAGDAADTAGMPLTPVAVAEGKVAASNMLASARKTPRYVGTPATMFTIPELTRVGLLEDEACARGLDLDVRFTDTSGWYSNFRIGEPIGAAKILIDRNSDQIVGGHFLGAGYSELANLIGLGMQLGIPSRQLRSMTASYPTLGSDLPSLL